MMYTLRAMKLLARSLPVLAFVVLLFAWSRDARADDDAHADMTTGLRSYYGGERTSAYVVATLSVLSVGGGVALVTRDSDFARGLGWPLVALGAIEGIGAIVYAFQVGGEIRHYEASLDHDAAAYRSEELSHMHGTTSRFVFYRLAELGLALGGVGIAAYGFAANADAWKGAGIGVAAIALPFLVIDTVNDARATRYTEQVRGFAPAPVHDVGPATVAPVPAALGATPLYLSLGGTF